MEDIQNKLKQLRKYIDTSNPTKRGLPKHIRQLSPSSSKDVGEIKYFPRINNEIRGKFKEDQYIPENNLELAIASSRRDLREKGLVGGGTKTGLAWHKCIGEYILKGEGKGKAVIVALQKTFTGIQFLQSEFPIYGYMVHKKTSEISLWDGIVDAIAWYNDKYVIVDWKGVDLLNFWEKNPDAYGKYLHQCLVYARLLKLHLELKYLPYILIVPVSNVTGKEIRPGLFWDFPKECKDKLDQYSWSKKLEPRTLTLPTNIVVANIKEKSHPHTTIIRNDVNVNRLFKYNCTVQQLLDALGFDELKIVD